MSKNLRQYLDPPNLVFVLVVAVGIISGFILNDDPYTPIEITLLFVLSVIFVIMGVTGFEYLAGPARIRYPRVLYFMIQIPLVGLILAVGGGNTYLVAFPLAAHSVVLFKRRGVLIVNLLLLLMLILMAERLDVDFLDAFQSIASFGTALLFVVIFTYMAVREQRTLAEMERLAAELSDANRKLREYAVQVEELAVAKERNRLAREIHDGLGHYLTAIYMQVKAAEAVIGRDPAQTRDALVKAQTLVQDALADVRRSVAALRDDSPVHKSLSDALAPIIAEHRSSGLVVELVVLGERRQLLPQVELTLYRAVQEGLTNVRKHALASRVDITLDYGAQSVRLRVQDNGVGAQNTPMDTENEATGFGLYGLRERTLLLGGSFDTVTVPGQGFCFELVIPI